MSAKKLDLETFIHKLTLRHPEHVKRWCFNESVYCGALVKMKVKCLKHAYLKWSVTPNQLLNGSICPECAKEARERSNIKDQNEVYTWLDFRKDLNKINADWCIVEVIGNLYQPARYDGKCVLNRKVLISQWGAPVNGLVGPCVVTVTPMQVFRDHQYWPDKLLRTRPDLSVDIPLAARG